LGWPGRQETSAGAPPSIDDRPVVLIIDGRGDVKRMWASVAAPFAELGAVDGLYYLAGRSIEKFSRGSCRLFRYRLVAQPVPPVGKGAPLPSGKTVIGLVNAGDPICSVFPRPASVIQARFGAGHRCLVAKVGGRFAGFIWIARDHYDEDEVRCRFVLTDPERSAWDFDVYVEPEFRLGRTFARLWEAANRLIADEGVRWSFSRISAFNAGSARSHARFGAQVLQTATFIRLGRVQFTFSLAAPFLHVGWRDEHGPEILLAPPKGGPA
jgi:hypothetical protein